MARRWLNDKYPCFVQVVRHEVINWHPTMSGVKVSTIPAIRAEFGVLGPEYQFEDEEGTVTTHAAISGGVYDLDADAEAKGWTEEEQQLIEAKLDEMCNQPWCGIRRAEQPVAVAPFPTYDTLDPKIIASVAAASGLVQEAIAYETENENRADVLKELRELVEQAQIEAELTAST
jgi:hypothetical protein